MRRTNLRGHALVNEGAAYERSDEGNWLKVYGSWTGHGVCECGEASLVLDGNNQRKRWHAEHKDEIRAAAPVKAGETQ